MTDQEVKQHLDTIYWELKKLLDECSEQQLGSIKGELIAAGTGVVRARNAMRVVIAFKKKESKNHG